MSCKKQQHDQIKLNPTTAEYLPDRHFPREERSKPDDFSPLQCKLAFRRTQKFGARLGSSSDCVPIVHVLVKAVNTLLDVILLKKKKDVLKPRLAKWGMFLMILGYSKLAFRRTQNFRPRRGCS